jgi:predicted phage terminase large subunit-like protein
VKKQLPQKKKKATPPKTKRHKHSFARWLAITTPKNSPWTWEAPHQRMLIEKLAKVTSGEIKRLMIFMPPRHGKSEMVTTRYIAYRLEMEPTLSVILASYNQKLANRFSRKAKRMLEKRLLLAKDRRAVDEWDTAKGGGVKAIGVGGGVTGYGAKLVVIDDPVKSRAEAESRFRRETAWEWFNDDIVTRLEPDGAVILIQTRWHQDDLAGRILRQQSDGGDAWEVLSLPAFAEENDPLGREIGAPLWPERFDTERLERIRRSRGSYSFASLYQQRPIPREGGIFKREWFAGCVIDRVPDGMKWFRGYDLAVSTSTTADFTASFRCAIDREGILYIADGFRGRIEYPDQRKYILGRIEEERGTVHGIESALHGAGFVQELRRDARLANQVFKSVRIDQDKVTRALAWAARAEEGKVRFLRGRWVDEFIDEAAAFPLGAHDDQVDAVSLAVQMIAKSRYISFSC